MPPFVGENSNKKVDCEFIINDEDFMKLASGELRPDKVIKL